MDKTIVYFTTIINNYKILLADRIEMEWNAQIITTTQNISGA
jgi:hypothetical protein